MPSIIETTVYQIDELSDTAKEQARSWYRENGMDYSWWDFIYDDFEEVCKILGISIETKKVPLMGGGTRLTPSIYFSGFWNQGDGACFAGRYSYAPGSAKSIRSYASQDEKLHSIADTLQTVQKRNFYQLHASISHQGRYCHEYSMSISVERDSDNYQEVPSSDEGIVIEQLRELARWLYRRLDEEYEHLTSDEAIDDTMRSNEYTFTATGYRFG